VLPEKQLIETPFARFKTSYSVEDNIFSYCREYELKGNYLGAYQFSELKSFLKKVVISDNSKFVLKYTGF